jgi:hypothetical protein
LEQLQLEQLQRRKQQQQALLTYREHTAAGTLDQLMEAPTLPTSLIPSLTIARVAEPALVADALGKLGVKTGHEESNWLSDLRCFDDEERSEMIVVMKGTGVTLMDRSKLRRLILGAEVEHQSATCGSTFTLSLRRVQGESVLSKDSSSGIPLEALAITVTYPPSFHLHSSAPEPLFRVSWV